jgi:hypothetical protein
MVSKITISNRIGGQQLGQNLNSDIILLGEIKKVIYLLFYDCNL